MRVARLPCELELRQPASPNGVVCAAVNGEVFFESEQSIRPGKVKETVKTHQ